MKSKNKKPLKTKQPVPQSDEKAAGMAGGAYTPPSVPLPKKTMTRWIWIGCIVLVLVAALHSANQPVGGGDTWVAMACGRYTLGPWAKEHSDRTWQMKVLDWFGIHTTQHDPLGARTREFNPDSQKFKNILIRSWGTFKETLASEEEKGKKHYDPELDNVGWVNQNWLTHVLFYKMKTAYGGDEYQPQKGEFLIVIYKFVQAVLTALFVYWAARVMGAHPLLAASAVAFGMLLSRSFIDLRPNVSSIFFAAIMILLISYWKKGRRWALAGMIPVMIIWSNVHGGFIYAIMIFVILLVGHAIQNYVGRANYAFLLLGLTIVFAILLLGAGDLQEEARTTEISKQNIAPDSPDHAMLQRKLLAIRISQGASISAAILILGIVILSFLRTGHIKAESYVQVGKPRLTFLAGAAALVILIPAVFSPFGWENLVHPLMVATGEEGKEWRQVIEWKPIWDTQGFGHATPYIFFLVLFSLVMLAWWVLFFFKPKTGPTRQRRKKTFEHLPWPKIDLAQIAVVAITLVMSVKSRRFIFLGGVILAPFLAVFAQEVINMARLLWCQKRQLPLQLMPMPKKWAWAWALLVFIPTGIIGWLFHSHMDKTYDYLHRAANKENTLPLFRRMVGISAQPVNIMPWFRQHGLKGIVFNDWTQGGFVAFHQKPDSQTGMPPCKLFIDGRAQAAYAIDHYKHWISVSSMPIVKRQNIGGRYREITPEVYAKILQDEGINVALIYLKRPREREIIQYLTDSKQWIPVHSDKDTSCYLLLRIDDPRNYKSFQKALPNQPVILIQLAMKHTQDFKHIFSDAPKALAQTFVKNPNEFRYLALKETQIFEQIFQENLPALNAIFDLDPMLIFQIDRGKSELLNQFFEDKQIQNRLKGVFHKYPQAMLQASLQHTQAVRHIYENDPNALAQIWMQNPQILRTLLKNSPPAIEQLLTHNLSVLNPIIAQDPKLFFLLDSALPKLTEPFYRTQQNHHQIKKALLQEDHQALYLICMYHPQTLTQMFHNDPNGLAQAFLQKPPVFTQIAQRLPKTFLNIFKENLPALNQVFLQNPDWLLEMSNTRPQELNRLYQMQPDGLRDILKEHHPVRRHFLLHKFELLNDLFQKDTAFWAELSKEKLELNQKKNSQNPQNSKAPPNPKTK